MWRIIISLTACFLLSACAETFYSMGQAGQRGQCSKLADSDASARCNEGANKSYDQYVRDKDERVKQ
jgi:hypothetical protein